VQAKGLTTPAQLGQGVVDRRTGESYA
jgi:hypothetical protein